MHVAALYRHPLKSHGREAIDEVTLTKGQTMPWDRHWAVTHEATKFDESDPKWMHCRNFMIGARTPGLAGIWAVLDEARAALTLSHQDLDDITIQPDNSDDVARFIRWVAPLCPDQRVGPTGIVKAPGRGMTDSPFATISIMTKASHDTVAQAMGTPLTLERWRGNIWVDGATPWQEHDWLNGDIRVGHATLRIRENIVRCQLTNTNPVTGKRDTDTLAALQNLLGAHHFGVYGEVIEGGKIMLGDTLEVL